MISMLWGSRRRGMTEAEVRAHLRGGLGRPRLGIIERAPVKRAKR